MKKSLSYQLAFLFAALLMTSCAKNFTQDAAGFEEIQNELKSKFGENAYYTNFTVTYDKTVGTIILVTETSDPESLKLEEWQYMRGAWEQRSDVTLEVSDGKSNDFMYQLSGKFDLKKIGDLIEQSVKKLADEKKIDNAKVKIVSMNTPDNDSAEHTKILIALEPANGGTSFSFFYDLDGNLLSFNY
jgi:citrate lyase gamma subunit